jgi:serine/threonine-protein kinase
MTSDKDELNQAETVTDTASQAETLNEATHPTKDSLIGVTLDGRYHIEKELGSGGIGRVYLARDKPELISRYVVIKVLREESLQSEWTVNKFRHEIEALAKIDHPGVTGVIDAGTLTDGAPYLVMQYVNGVTLRSMIEPVRDRGLDFESAANIIRQVCFAVSSAHEKGIYHRDLKPENIMIRNPNTDKAQVKVIDFGIAKLTDPVSAPGTVVEKFVGTPGYMSPEQVFAMPVMAASDIYSMGVIAYEMLTGRRPFNFETPFQLAEMQSAGVSLMPRDLRPALTIKAQNIILKSLAFESASRYQEISSFGDDLAQALLAGPTKRTEALKNEDEISTLPMPGRDTTIGRRNLSRLLITILGLMLIGVGGLILWLKSNSKPEAKSPNTINSGSPAPTVKLHTISYYMQVQKYRNGAPYQKPFLVPGEINFEKDDRVQIFFTSPEQGYFYLLNQGPKKADGTWPNLIILFPEEDKPALLPPDQRVQIPPPSTKPDEDWIGFDAAEGTEELWMIWSTQPVPELEAAKKWSNRKDEGEIKDINQGQEIREFLASYHSSSAPDAKKNVDGTKTTVIGKDSIIVYKVNLQHY